MKKYILIIFLSFFFSLNVVKADSNYNTSYDVVIDEDIVDFTRTIDNNNVTLSDFLDSLISLHSDYYKLFIDLYYYQDHNPYSVNLYIIPNDVNNLDIELFGVNSSISINSSFKYFISPISRTSYSINIRNSVSDIYNSTNYTNFYNCFVNNQCNTFYNSYISGDMTWFTNNNYFNNASNYIISQNINQEFHFIYYSDIDLTLTNIHNNNTFCSNPYTCFYKSIMVNNDSISFDSHFPTYYDLYMSSQPTFNNYSKQLNRVFVGNIPKANISDFKIKTQFNSSSDSIESSLKPFFYYFGRVNHGTYYSYESINCGSNIYQSYAITNNYYDGYILPYGFSCTSNLSNYDEIFLRIDFLPQNDDYLTYNLNLSTNYGYVYNFDNITNSVYNLNQMYIFESLNSLPNDFSIMLSTNDDKAYEYHLSNQDSTISYFLDRTSKNIIEYSYDSFGSVTNSMLNIFNYNYNNQNNVITDLKLFVSPNTIISIGNNNSYTYYDDSNQITNGLINNDNVRPNTDKYDLSYYFGIINDYIDSISADVYDFSLIVQNCYNLIPSPFDIMLFILFILGCMFLLFKLIKR